ncbi:hypothetical protein SPHINGO8AM_130159 [Sphingomonas sp. 8AM]|nr:hypothetical protein SPHINGO8AM_130159 [Sphingomonas sp. 8AM]
MDPVAPGLRSDIDDRIADPGSGRIEDLVGIRDADRHRIDEDVAVIGGVEIDLAADGRHADAIAIAADAVDDARDQVAHLRMIGPAEAQGVEIGDRPRAHREHVAQDAADPGRRALIGFDVRGVVVALHLEDRGLPVADIDHAGILAGAADDLWALGRQLLQMDAARLVAAMLGPHHREDAEFNQIGLAAERVEDTVIFLGGQAVVGDDLGRDDGHARAHSGTGAAMPDAAWPPVDVGDVCAKRGVWAVREKRRGFRRGSRVANLGGCRTAGIRRRPCGGRGLWLFRVGGMPDTFASGVCQAGLMDDADMGPCLRRGDGEGAWPSSVARPPSNSRFVISATAAIQTRRFS